MKTKLNFFLVKLHIFLTALGLNLNKTLSYRFLWAFNKQRIAFKKAGGKYSNLYPILDDYKSSAGVAKGHYFHQDLLVATFINKNNPKIHIDVASRVDGFVAHLASFREVEVIDIRNLPNSHQHTNIKFKQGDIMNIDDSHVNSCDSLSCLHAVEHFGLGRYGDDIDPKGHIKGFINLCQMVKSNGTLFISFPIGAPKIYFNAHRIFSPEDILSWINEYNIGASIERFDFVDDDGNLHLNKKIDETPELKFGCGIYTLAIL